MIPPDPNYLAEAVKVFLAQAQRQADQDPATTRLHGEEIRALREAIAALQGRVAHVDARTASYDPAAPPGGPEEGGEEVRALWETVAALEGRVARGDSCVARLEKVVQTLLARLDELEATHEEVARSQEQFSRLVDSLAEMESRDAPVPVPVPVPVPQARKVAPGCAAEQHQQGDQQDDREDDQGHDGHDDQPPPRRETRRPNPRRKAFEAHVLATRRQYHLRKPGKDHRPFIWSFIEGIRDQECARWTQEYLMDKLPGKTWRSKCPRKGRMMALGMDLRWEDVKEALKQMPTPSFLQ